RVGQGGEARAVGADQVSLNLVTACQGTGDEHAAGAVARDDIAGRTTRGGRQTADRVGRRVKDEHSDIVVAQGQGTGCVGADQVARDHVPRRSGDQFDAVGQVR